MAQLVVAPAGLVTEAARRVRVGRTALVVAMLAAAVASPGPAAAASCAEAEKLLTSRQFAKAEEAYRALAEAGAECANTPVSALAARRLALARALARQGQNAEALKALNAALEASPVLVVPRSLRRVLEADRGFAAARQLDSTGFHGAAAKLAERTHRRFPEVVVPADTRPLLEHAKSQNVGWARDRLNWLGDSLNRHESSIGTFVRALGVLVGLVVLFFLLYKYARALLTTRLVFSPFTGGAKGDEPALSHGLALEAQHAVRRLNAGRGATQRIDFASAANSELKLGATLGSSSHFGFVAAILELVQLLLPRRDLTITGHLQPADAGGAAVSIALAETDGRIFDDTTLRGSAFGSTPETPAAEIYRRLATPAAVWTLFTVARRLGKPTPLDLDDWRSYALFAAGTEWHLTGQVETARRLYLEALALDSSVFSAELNLGLLEIRLGGEENDAQRIERGVERLLHVREARSVL
jgi:tetratricopeptide (TPR) repeat protein